MSDDVDLRLFIIGWPEGVRKLMQQMFYEREHQSLIIWVGNKYTRANPRVFFAHADYQKDRWENFFNITQIEIDFCSFADFLLCLKIIYGHEVRVPYDKFDHIMLCLDILGVHNVARSACYSGNIRPVLPSRF